MACSRKIYYQFFFYCLLLVGCDQPVSFTSEKKLPPVTAYCATHKEAKLIEQGIDSKDISNPYMIEIGTSLYPNIHDFRLTKVKRYLRTGRGDGMDYTVEYFATADDSVRTILHEWNMPKEPGLLINNPATRNSELSEATGINAFQRKFTQLDSIFTSLLGVPTFKDIQKRKLTETERDQVKWLGPNQLNVYLLMFKRDEDLYRQIRVVVYPE